MKLRFASPLLLIGFLGGWLLAALPATTQAQSAVLGEIYGRGVHAFNAGQNQQAYDLFSLAISNGIQDPRAYYFRGLVAHATGRSYEADSDWQYGAQMEAKMGGGPTIGRSLARVQGSLRLKLELIREKARLQALAAGLNRSQIRMQELGGSAAAPAPGAFSGAAPRGRAVVPPPPPAGDNPFADDLGQEPMVETGDAFKDVMDNPLADSSDGPAAPDQPAAGGGDPFGGGADAAAPDPFGAPAAGDDPFGAPAPGADPFGGGESMDNPFGS